MKILLKEELEKLTENYGFLSIKRIGETLEYVEIVDIDDESVVHDHAIVKHLYETKFSPIVIMMVDEEELSEIVWHYFLEGEESATLYLEHCIMATERGITLEQLLDEEENECCHCENSCY